MKFTSPLSLPSHAFAFLLWFATLIFGAVLLTIYFLVSGMKELGLAFFIPVVGSCFAGFFSLPILAVLPFGLRWVFTAATQQQRWLRLVAVVLGLFIVAALGGYWALTRSSVHKGDRLLLYLALPYLPAALAAAACIYRPWLFRS